MIDAVALARSVLMMDTTPGPWWVNAEGAVVSPGSNPVFRGYFDGTCDKCGEQISAAAKVAIGDEDARFIAVARSLIPELVAEIESLCDEIDTLITIRDIANNYGIGRGA